MNNFSLIPIKKWICFLLFILICQVVSAQVLISILFGDKLNSGKLEFGLMVSPTLCNITQIYSEYRPGLGLGLYFNLKISDRFYFHPEAIPKSALGAKKIAPYPVSDSVIDELFINGSVQRNIKAISVPLLIRYRVAGLWFLEAGPQIDWMLQVKDIFKTKIDDNDLTNTKKVGDQFTHFDFGVAGGLVYKFKKDISMAMGLRYFYGLTDIMKSVAGGQHNGAWLLNIYIPVGAGKAAAKKQKASGRSI